MRNPDQATDRFHKQFPGWLRVILFLALCVCITAALNYGLTPPSSVKIDLHNLRNGETHDTIFIGTSHGQYGIGPFCVGAASGGSSVSLYMADACPDDMYHMLRLACGTQSPSHAVYEPGPSYWMNEQRSGSTQIFFYQEFPASRSRASYFLDKIINPDFRSALTPWSYYRNLIGQVPDHICRKQSPSYKNYGSSALEIPGGHYAGCGFIYRDRVEGEGKGIFSNIPWDKSQVKPKAELYFNRIVEFYRENDIELTVITTPAPQKTLDASAGSYGQSHQYFKNLLEGWGLGYYNFNYMESELMDCGMERYWDYDDHMDGIKAQEFSTLLGRLLGSLDQGNLEYNKFFSNTYWQIPLSSLH